MIRVSDYAGTKHFGRAYQRMYEQDVHAPGSVDRILLEQMAHLSPETARYLYSDPRPTTAGYPPGNRPALEDHAQDITYGCSSIDAIVEAIVAFCGDLGHEAPTSLDGVEFGGTEEEIIRRGSSWCTDVARVGCVFCESMSLRVVAK
jgi:hypothetical protein